MSGMKQKALSNPPSQPCVEGGLDIARALTTNTLAVFGTVRQADSERGGDEAQVKARASSQQRPRLDLATGTHPAGCGGHRLRTA